MSEFISMATYLNADPKRVNTIVEIVIDFFDDVDPEILEKRLKDELGTISSGEFAYAAQLFADGEAGASDLEFTEKHELMLHTIFDNAMGIATESELPPGHPVHTFLKENVAINALVIEMRAKLKQDFDTKWWKESYTRLWQVNTHYLRKENQLFPFLEKKKFDRPSTVMWSVHDRIRADIKKNQKLLDEGKQDDFLTAQPALLEAVEDMTFKEEKILLPTSLDLLSDTDWDEIRRGEDELGFCLIAPPPAWFSASSPTPKRATPGKMPPPNEDAPKRKAKKFMAPKNKESINLGAVGLTGGFMTPEQINLLFKNLPTDISFVDEWDQVKFYNRGDERVFPRSPGIIDREVRYCHPPKSVHMVLQIVDAFKAGERDTAEFWIQMGGKFIHIRYFAVRDLEGNYKGVLEVSQDVTHLRELENRNE